MREGVRSEGVRGVERDGEGRERRKRKGGGIGERPGDSQKRPMYITKETYVYHKRDLCISQKRPGDSAQSA